MRVNYARFLLKIILVSKHVALARRYFVWARGCFACMRGRVVRVRGCFACMRGRAALMRRHFVCISKRVVCMRGYFILMRRHFVFMKKHFAFIKEARGAVGVGPWPAPGNEAAANRAAGAGGGPAPTAGIPYANAARVASASSASWALRASRPLYFSSPRSQATNSSVSNCP